MQNEAPTGETAKLRILVVEDNMPVAMMIAHLLTRAKCEVVVARTARKGMQLAESGDFSLVTLDIHLPDSNGFEVCSRLKKNPWLRETPIVFVSGPCGQDVQRTIEVGAADYIVKPFEVFGFASRVLAHVTANVLAANEHRRTN